MADNLASLLSSLSRVEKKGSTKVNVKDHLAELEDNGNSLLLSGGSIDQETISHFAGGLSVEDRSSLKGGPSYASKRSTGGASRSHRGKMGVLTKKSLKRKGDAVLPLKHNRSAPLLNLDKSGLGIGAGPATRSNNNNNREGGTAMMVEHDNASMTSIGSQGVIL